MPQHTRPGDPGSVLPAPVGAASYAYGAPHPPASAVCPSRSAGSPLARVLQGSAQRGDPFDMQSVALRGSEAEEECHSGAWRRGHRKVREPQERPSFRAWGSGANRETTSPERSSGKSCSFASGRGPPDLHRLGEAASERSEQRAACGVAAPTSRARSRLRSSKSCVPHHRAPSAIALR